MRVCYKLRREIEDLFPPKTTPAERLVALEIAEYGKLATRISTIPPALLQSRTGMSTREIGESVTLLKKRGLDFRRPFRYSDKGLPVYSWRGVHPEYRVPDSDEFRKAWELCGAAIISLPSGPWRIAAQPLA